MSDTPETRFRIEHAFRSDVGMRRANNQDAIAVYPKRESGLHEGDCFYVVADGMGAHAAGEEASKMAAESVPVTFLKLTDLIPPAALRQAVRNANHKIHTKGQKNPEMQGMGTTCSCLAVLGNKALVAHVGDSRVYRLRSGVLEQLTFDHSLVWEMAAQNNLREDQIPSGVPKNIITRSLGPQETVNIDLEGPFELRDDDEFLLCSDGLSGVVSDHEIGAIVGAMAPDEATQTLVDLANLRGGPDNISVIVARVSGVPIHKHNPNSDGKLTPRQWVATCAVAAACVAGFGLYLSWGDGSGMAVMASVALSAMLTAWLGRPSGERPTEEPLKGGPYGKGPYRTHECGKAAPAAEALQDAATELERLKHNEAPSPVADLIGDWKVFDEQRRAGESAMKMKDHAVAVRCFSSAIRDVMRQASEDRTRRYPAGGMFEDPSRVI
ncbi:putative protein phosphatase 2C-type [Pseudobythopirellula maris]|uniref:PPM-type phosphatase domain-containing protein n=1 Tax=Pseudobythopirellula maris TaxID=2527991 RepID=A0A5C5ZIF8_9BACT|nr:PP2C family serine/threonine-protein phosphatase [Pseudobythopirellula maris]TWT86930.1 putative protein phosphatase 2C-type [Pseudobythopirellula maris]